MVSTVGGRSGQLLCINKHYNTADSKDEVVLGSNAILYRDGTERLTDLRNSDIELF